MDDFKCEAEIYFKISVPASQETNCLSTTRGAGNCCLRKESLLIVIVIGTAGGEVQSIEWRTQGINWLQALGSMRGKTTVVRNNHN